MTWANPGKLTGRLTFAFALLLGFSTNPAFAAETVEEIRACVSKNFPNESVRQAMTLTSTDRAGGNRTLEALMYAQRDDNRQSIMMKVSAPAELAGTRYLYREKSGKDELYMYIPAVNRIRRVKGSQKSAPLFGTDFSYEDIQHLRGGGIDFTTTRLADRTLTEREAFVLQMVPDPSAESGYERIIQVIDKLTCLPLEIEFFESGETPRKRLSLNAEAFVEVGTSWAATQGVIVDLREETQTAIESGKVEYDNSIPSQVFSTQNFHRGG